MRQSAWTWKPKPPGLTGDERAMKPSLAILAPLLLSLPTAVQAAESAAAPQSLWAHIRQVSDLGELRGMTAQWEADSKGTVLRLTAGTSQTSYAWAVIPAPARGWDLARRESANCEIANRGSNPVNVLLWVVGGG